MDFLRRQHAPIAAASWALIDEQAREVLSANFSARKLVSVSGPHGPTHAAVNLGRLVPPSTAAGDGVFYGVRQVLPLVEVRVPFALDLWQLDDVVRGARDPDLGPLVTAAGKLVAFEEHAIYEGLPSAGIIGMAPASRHAVVVLPRETSGWAELIAQASIALRRSGVKAPYALVTGPEVFRTIEQHTGQYPLHKQIEALIGGSIVLAPYVAGAFLLAADATRDFELVLGQDVSIGFEQQQGQALKLYLTESFTFRVLEPQAVVAFACTAQTAEARHAGQEL